MINPPRIAPGKLPSPPRIATVNPLIAKPVPISYWVEVMGYERHEVIGRKLTEFFTEDSRRLAQDQVFPAFFQKGFCKDVPYRFVKKSGEVVDVLLSAITDRDAAGSIAGVAADANEAINATELWQI